MDIHSIVGVTLQEIRRACVKDLMHVSKWEGFELYTSKSLALELEKTELIDATRGLVIDTRAEKNGEWPVAALPLTGFREFDYLKQTQSPVYQITEKLDGALVNSFLHEGRVVWTGRRFFSSLVADAANAVWLENHSTTTVPPEITLVCELIHPISRVLIQYDKMELILVGGRNRFNGDDLSHEGLVDLGKQLAMPVVRLEEHSLEQALQNVQKFSTQQEGYVLRLENGIRVKVSSPLYNAIYSLRQECSPWRVSRLWRHGWDGQQLTQHLPEDAEAPITRIFGELDAALLDNKRNFHDLRQLKEAIVSQYRSKMGSAARENLTVPITPDV